MKKKNSRAAQPVKSTGPTSSPALPQSESGKGSSESISSAENPAIHIPPILLEGDDVREVAQSKEPQGSAASEQKSAVESPQLPDSYGTERLLLIARDPHWLYAHWDLSREQQLAYNQRSFEGHLVLRVQPQAAGASPNEIQLQPESRHWFVEAGQAGGSYVAELGYYENPGRWVCISASAPATTPVEQASEDKSLVFGSARIGERGQERHTIPPRVEWLPALDKGAGFSPELPASPEEAPEFDQWRSSIEATTHPAFEALTTLHSVRTRQISSFEITESIRREIEREISSSQFGGEWPVGISSPSGEPAPQIKAFWFNVNAELIIYGATEPDAQVTIAGQPIQLRPDGTFTCRLALPDGEFELEVAATSVQQESQKAQLKFSRSSRYQS